ncbi:MAG: hypothetical protein O7A06_14740, partial [Acidobacteria bacterium]|nr:hypothetical protein [Acidobacteriota bacterium]
MNHCFLSPRRCVLILPWLAIFLLFLTTEKGQAHTVTTSSLPNGAVGASYSATLQNDGNPPFVWSLSSGSLPTGLSLSSSGIISGTPTTAGTFTFTVAVLDSPPLDAATRTFTVIITGANLDGDYLSTVQVAFDPGNNATFVGMPGVFTITVQGSETSTTTFTAPSASSWVPVSGVLSFVSSSGSFFAAGSGTVAREPSVAALSGSFFATGSGTVGVEPNVEADFSGVIDSSGQLIGVYRLGFNGGLPNGFGIHYNVLGQLQGPQTDCTFRLSHLQQFFLFNGGTEKVGVITQPGCSWNATINDSFLSISSGSFGTGSGTVNYSALSNGGSGSRVGTLTIAGLTFTVDQAGFSPLFLLRPELLSFSVQEGATQQEQQIVAIFSPTAGLAFAAMAATTTGGNWLSVNPASGTAPSSLVVAVNPNGLLEGSYQGTVTVTVSSATPSTRTVTVSLTVEPARVPTLAVRPGRLRFPFVLGADAQTTRIGVFNEGGGTLAFQATASTLSGGSWLMVSPASGTALLGTPGALAVTADPTGLAAGTYRGVVTVSTNPSIDVPVTMTISPAQQLLRLSQRGLTFRSVSGVGAAPPSQSFGVRNTGIGTLNWMASSLTLSGDNWLTVTPLSGSTDAASGNVPEVTVSIDSTGLAAGEYYGRVEVTSPEADNSPQVISVVLNVLPAGSNPGAVVRPAGVVFTAIAGGSDPDSQTITVSNLTDSSKTFASGRFTSDGSDWFTQSPISGTVSSSQPSQIVLQARIAGLSAGVRRGTLTLAFGDGSVRIVEMALVLADTSGSTQRLPPIARLAGCTPMELQPVFTLLGNQFNVSAAWPVPIETTVVDDCGDPLTTGSVLLTFSNGDPPLPLQSLQDGRWSGTWQARNAGVSEVTITATATAAGAIPGTTIQGTTQLVGGLQANP